ncbi:hypothetical protein [uncultured Microbacterium sp.]|uniref:hypothetical protein n=1 Tax=uncultured Microbacterium sp. TaxID=191216 RepID=UPI0028E2C2BF|nr:hypothetical protein [uncultured Microbacterium sp.]
MPTLELDLSGNPVRVLIAHPEFARVEAYRKEVRIPTKVTIRWAKQYPSASEEWSGKWDRSPMRHLGCTVRMVAFRQTFRDLLGDIHIEEEVDERDLPAGLPAPEPDARVERDWGAEIAAAETVEQIDKVEADARTARAFTPNAAGTTRRRHHPPPSAARPPQGDRRVGVGARPHQHTGPEPELEQAAVERPEPRDYLPPQNRADRRAARRKKGRR